MLQYKHYLQNHVPQVVKNLKDIKILIGFALLIIE